MPSLNQAAFIETAIGSALGQDHPVLELIVADGGSTDGTLDILARIQARDTRLRWFSGPDTGPANAINKALAQVRGTVIGWLNSDDVYAEGAVARAAQALAANPAWLMVYGQGTHISEEGTPIGHYPTLPPSTPVSRFLQGCFICQPTVFFRRTLHVMLGPFDETLKTAFDFEYWLRVFVAAPARIGFVDATQASSRLHDQCITQTMRRTVAIESMRVLARHIGHAPPEWLLTYFEEMVAGASRATQAQCTDFTAAMDEAAPSMSAPSLRALRARLDADSRWTGKRGGAPN